MTQNRATPMHPIARALQKFREARMIESEALGEIIGVVMADLKEAASVTTLEVADKTEYLSVKQLALRIPYAERSIRNLMVAGVLIEGTHYFKRRGRVIFSWQAMQNWVRTREAGEPVSVPLVRNKQDGR